MLTFADSKLAESVYSLVRIRVYNSVMPYEVYSELKKTVDNWNTGT